MKPAVTICMPAFNAGRFIRKAIDSLISQTFSNYELIIIDDGSYDRTWQIARQYANVDQRIRLFRNDTNQGLVYTRNRCIKMAKSPFIALADADDIFDPLRIERQMQFMNANPDVGVLGANVSFIDESGVPVREPSRLYLDDKKIRFFLMLGPCIWNTVTMYRHDLLLDVGGYRQGFDSGAEDYDLWSRLLKVTNFANLDMILASVHVHSSSVTANGIEIEQNISRIARDMLSEYLDVNLSYEAVEDLLTLFCHGLGQQKDVSQAFGIALMIKDKAERVEAPDTYKRLCQKMNVAFWIQARSQIYLNRKQSLELTLSALLLAPGMILTTEFAKYVFRWLIPDRLRLWLKSKRKVSALRQIRKFDS